jgi:hypothetical protein
VKCPRFAHSQRLAIPIALSRRSSAHVRYVRSDLAFFRDAQNELEHERAIVAVKSRT